jgi:carboxyl-terminal processing protease
MTLRDGSRGALWNGPLAVMVNGGSASASEILAAAMQDYKRAVIIGSPTFGKGTVQKVVSVEEGMDLSARMKAATSNDPLLAPIGSVKLTMQKFYRVNGGSTQLRGVTPDIVLPDPYKYIELGERRDKTALPWDVIPAANYKPVPDAVNVAALKSKSAARVTGNTAFAVIDESAKRLKKLEDDNLYSLNEEKFRAQQKESSALSKKLDALEERGTALPIGNPKEDLASINRDSTTIAKNTEWIKLLKKDIYLAETIAVMGDLVKQTGNWSVNQDAKD